jgi:orotate phosphoribosyltransferase
VASRDRSTSFVDLLESIGALKTGHFLLASGRHSDQYVEKFDLLRSPRSTEEACGELIDKLGSFANVDLVVGPTTGGIILAFEVGRQLGLPTAYAEREREGAAERAFKRGTVITPESTVLVVDDILTTGGSIRETLAAVEAWSATTKAIAVLVDRSAGTVQFGPPVVSLVQLNIASWTAEECPLCRDNRPLVKPGSTGPGVQQTR